MGVSDGTSLVFVYVSVRASVFVLISQCIRDCVRTWISFQHEPTHWRTVKYFSSKV